MRVTAIRDQCLESRSIRPWPFIATPSDDRSDQA
jgi:hypothetical protein